MDFVASAAEFKSCHHGVCSVVCWRVGKGPGWWWLAEVDNSSLVLGL